jgi:hypothetical protein
MSNLLTNIERQSGISSLLTSARGATAILTDIEQHLNANWDKLIGHQLSCRPPNLPGNALFHPKGGWAFVIDQNGASDETVRVYRQNRAGEATVQAGFYLNVTDSAVRDAALSNLLKKLAVPSKRQPQA